MQQIAQPCNSCCSIIPLLFFRASRNLLGKGNLLQFRFDEANHAIISEKQEPEDSIHFGELSE